MKRQDEIKLLKRLLRAAERVRKALAGIPSPDELEGISEAMGEVLLSVSQIEHAAGDMEEFARSGLRPDL